MADEILDAQPELEVAIYAVWFDMVAGDSRSRWPDRLLDDPRVRHWWDEGKAIGRWFGRHPDYGDDPDLVIWDTYFLYAPTSTWADGQGPTDLASWGYTIVENREKLRRDLLAMAAAKAEAGGDGG